MTINEMEQMTKILRDDIFERLPNELVYFLVKNRNSNDYDLDQITEEFYNEHTNFWSINPMLGEILKERGADLIEVLGLTIWGRKQKDGNIWNDLRLLNVEKELPIEEPYDDGTAEFTSNRDKYIDYLADRAQQEEEERIEGEEFMALN